MATARVTQLTEERKRHLEDNGRSHNPYAHEEAMDRLLGRDGPAIARTLGLARRTVNQWREKFDSDHRGPGRTLSIAMHNAQDMGRELTDVLAPVAAILNEFDAEIALRGQVKGGALAQTTATANDALQQVCEAIQCALVAVADEEVSAADFAVFEVQYREAIARFHQLHREMELRVTAARFVR